MPGKPPEHGTRSKYVRGCRCTQCTTANNNYKIEYLARKGHVSTRIPRRQDYRAAQRLRWPTKPITALQPHWDATKWADAAGCSTRNWLRWTNEGLPDDASDRLAVSLGLHPVQVWPDWLDKAEHLIRHPRKRAA